jgi:hypothetical protein
MQFPHTSTLTRRRAQGRRPWLTAVCGAALLAVAAAGTWQTLAQRGSATSTTGTGPAAGITAGIATRPFIDANRDSTPMLYLVGSPEEAVRVQAALDEREGVLKQFGGRPVPTRVLVVTAVEDEARIAQAQAEADVIRATLGLPPLPLIDLRSR